MLNSILKKIESKESVVGIVGLGYVGLPLAILFGEKTFKVLGFDVDEQKIDELNGGNSYIEHIPSEKIKNVVDSGYFEPVRGFERLSDCDFVLMCVPTPLTEHLEPDLTYVTQTCETVRKYLKQGTTVILESTTYPGTTEEVILPLLETSGLISGKDFFIAYSPEREDPGNPDFHTATIAKVVGGLGGDASNIAIALYSSIIENVVAVSDPKTAEATKLLENIYRSVNIALVNELKLLFDRMGINVWEVIRAAATKPFGFQPFYPGPGLGGHCIPIDPFYLTWKAREYDFPTRFIQLAGEINTFMPYFVVGKLQDALNEQGKSLNGAKILMLGMAYKRNVDDVRESPAFKILDLLHDRNCRVSYHDPHVPRLKRTRKYHFELSSVSLNEETLKSSDAVLIVTDHTKVDYQLVVDHAPLVIDTRNATGKIERGREKIVLA